MKSKQAIDSESAFTEKRDAVARLLATRLDLSAKLSKADPGARHKLRDELDDLDVGLSAAEGAVRAAQALLSSELDLDDEADARAQFHAFNERAGKAGDAARTALVTAVRTVSEAQALRERALDLGRALGVYAVDPRAIEPLHSRVMEKLSYGSDVVSHDEIKWPYVRVTLDVLEVGESIATRMSDRSTLIKPDAAAKHAAVAAALAAREAPAAAPAGRGILTGLFGGAKK